MMISTKGRYALRVMADLAEHGPEYVSLSDVSARQAVKNGVASIRNMTVRERFLQKIFGNSRKIIIIVPGDTVRELAIKEVQTNGKNE